MAQGDILVTHHATLLGHTSDVTWVDFSYNMLATCSSDKTIRLWDITSIDDGIKEVSHSPFLGHKYTVHCCCFSPLGTLLATCSMDGYVIIWDPKTGAVVECLKHPSRASIRVCKFSPDSAYLATGSEDDSLVVWELATTSILKTFIGHDGSVTACSFTPDSQFVVSGSTNGDLRLWDVKRSDDTHIAYESEGHDLGVMGCEFSPVVGAKHTDVCNKRYLLATCGNDDNVQLFDVTTGTRNSIVLATIFKGHQGTVMCCRFSSNGKFLLSASGDKTVIVWNVNKRCIVMKLLGHDRYVTSCAFSLCNNYIASGSNDKTVFFWKIAGSKLESITPSAPSHHLLPVEGWATQHPLFIVKIDDKTPSEYLCPITHEIMQDPVIASDGFTYERKAITQWLSKGKVTSPMTNGNLSHVHLTPNHALKMLIQRHLGN